MSQRGREGGMKREIALLLWMIMTSVALLLCSLCRPEAAFWQPLCCAVPPRQHGIQFHISFALCTVVCLSLSLAAAAVARRAAACEQEAILLSRSCVEETQRGHAQRREGSPRSLSLLGSKTEEEEGRTVQACKRIWHERQQA